MQRRTSHFLLLGHVFLGRRQLAQLAEDLCKYARQEYGALAKEFGLVRKELYSATEEFGLAKLLS